MRVHGTDTRATTYSQPTQLTINNSSTLNNTNRMLLFLYCNWYLTLLVTEIGGLIMSLLSIITWRQQLCFILNWYWLLRPLARGSYTCLRRVTYHDFHARLHTGRETSGGESGRTGLMISITSRPARCADPIISFMVSSFVVALALRTQFFFHVSFHVSFHCCYWKQVGAGADDIARTTTIVPY